VFLDSTDPAASQALNKEGISAVWTVLAKQRWGVMLELASQKELTLELASQKVLKLELA